MTKKRTTVETLIEELRSLAGVSSVVSSMVDEEVDWIIPTDDMDDDARDLLLRLGSKPMGLSEGGKLDTSIRETVKGSLGVLSKRIEGIGDLVDMGKPGSVYTALEKVIKDAQTLLDSVATGNKKEQVQGKKNKQKSQDPPDPKSQEDQKGDKPTAKERSQAAAPRQSGGAPQGASSGGSSGERGVQRTQESVMMVIGSEVITEAQMSDPFGMGESFKADIVRMSTMKRKPVEEG